MNVTQCTRSYFKHKRRSFQTLGPLKTLKSDAHKNIVPMYFEYLLVIKNVQGLYMY